MALRLNNSVLRGEIDNRVEGHVAAKLWLKGRDEPACLSLRGNCLSDIAGHRLVFVNAFSGPTDGDGASTLQAFEQGIVGDITASYRNHTPAVSGQEARDGVEAGQVMPMQISNGMYFEWFDPVNGRVVVELPDFKTVELSAPVWSMSRDAEDAQLEQNRLSLREYVNSRPRGSGQPEECDDESEYAPLDEFEWERRFKQSDVLTDKFRGVFEKYVDHPDGDRLMAREMGWDWLDDAMDAEDRGSFDEDSDPADDAPMEPNPLTEGTDWIRTPDNRIKHPLSDRAFRAAVAVRHLCKDRQLLGDNADEDLRAMIFHTQTLSAKLAGALDSLAYEEEPDAGFVVACLKRAHPYFEQALQACGAVSAKNLLPEADLLAFRKELFEIREQLLGLMKHFRAEL